MTSAALQTYRRKRDFKKTPEPRATAKASNEEPHFVIQKHAASHLHYDFRLEANGVLKSWAVPKGPSMNPHVKRLAVETEDHPMDYSDFEGVIPQGQYGGGNVIVWDNGTFRNTTQHQGQPQSLQDGIKRGHISFFLNGKKIRGGYALTRIRPGAKPQWLLVKAQDAEAAADNEPVETQLESVLSGKTIEAVAQGKPKVWQSNRSASRAEPPISAKKFPAQASNRPLPLWIAPMLATLVDQAFDRPDWIFEPKLDGERCIAYRDKNGVRLFTRNQKPLNETYPELVNALQRQAPSSFIADGEIVAFEPGGNVSSFYQLQQRMHLKTPRDVARSKVAVYYYLFDLMYLEERDLRSEPLSTRKDRLRKAFRFNDLIRLNPFVLGQGSDYYRQACRRKWEGVIAKRAASVYAAGRSQDWLKFKCLNEQEFVIGGYSDPQGARDKLGALLLGYYDQGRLRFAGKVGTGFDAAMLALVADKLAPLKRKTSPFAAIDISSRGLHWVEPRLVAQIAFGEWTQEGKLRQGRFLGLRDDKVAENVSREKPADPPPESDANESRKRTPSRASRPDSNSLLIDKKSIAVTHLNKIFYPATGFTKGQMLDYYVKAAPALLPHLHSRPMTLKRYPDGVDKFFFYEKNAPSYRPEWLSTYAMRDEKSGRETRYCVINDLASLVWAANLGTLELHSLLARAPRVDEPTMIAFDLDPGPPASLVDCLRVGLSLRKILDDLGLESFCKTSGGKGLHVYIPLNVKATYSATQDFAHAIALLLERQDPAHQVSNMRKELRVGKVLIDWSQNSRHKTTVTAYSLRAQPHPSVSTPITWKEVEHALQRNDPASLNFTPDAVLQRLKRLGDLFAPVQTLKQTLPEFENLKGDPHDKNTKKIGPQNQHHRRTAARRLRQRPADVERHH